MTRLIAKQWSYRLLHLLIITGTIFRPQFAVAQVVAADTGINDLMSLANTFSEPVVILPDSEKALWNARLTGGSINDFDKRWTATLPYLGEQFGTIIADVTDSTTDNLVSTEFDGSTANSPLAKAKGFKLRAIGTTSCGTVSYFARRIDTDKPLWLHLQNSDSNYSADPVAFDQSFDGLARQFFWLEGRAFTNRLITPTSWSEFLRDIAKGEIEERFGLAPGTLANTAASELDTKVAEIRLAHSLGLTELPQVNSSTDFYTTLGQWHFEEALSLPHNSFVGQNWTEIYQNIGLRVLEQQLDVPVTNTISPFGTAAENITDNDRILLVTKYLENRGGYYKDPRLAFNLPTEVDLPTTPGGNSIYTRLVNSDPTAYATAGAYFLAERLGMSSADTKSFIRAVDQNQERVPSLGSAKPFNNELKINAIFNLDAESKARAALFEQLGRPNEDIISSHLPALNETILLALTGSNRTPDLLTVTSGLTNDSQRQSITQKIAAATLREANYPNGFTTQALAARGQALLGDSVNLSTNDIAGLTDPNSTQAEDTGEVIDIAMGWPTQTDDEGNKTSVARQLAVREQQGSNLALGEKQIITVGANKLWDQFSLPDTLKQQLNNLYFNAVFPTNASSVSTNTGNGVDTTDQQGEAGDETVTTGSSNDGNATGDEPSIDTGTTDNTVDDEDTTGETVNFDIPAPEVPFAQNIRVATGLPITEVVNLLLGSISLPRLTLTALGVDLANSSTITADKLVALYDQPTADKAQALIDQADSITDDGFINTADIENLKQAVTAKDNAQISRWVNQLAIKQWNITCGDKQQEVKNRIDAVVAVLAALPRNETGGTTDDQPTGPTQIITVTDSFSDATTAALDTSYPSRHDKDNKTGALTTPRAYDHIEIVF